MSETTIVRWTSEPGLLILIYSLTSKNIFLAYSKVDSTGSTTPYTVHSTGVERGQGRITLSQVSWTNHTDTVQYVHITKRLTYQSVSIIKVNSDRKIEVIYVQFRIHVKVHLIIIPALYQYCLCKGYYILPYVKH